MATYRNGIYVDGIFFDIPMVSLKRTADFYDKYANRLENGDLERELIGVYYNYSMKVGSSNDFAENDYKKFWDKMTEPVEFHDFVLPDYEGNYGFRGYVTKVSDEYEKILSNKSVFKSFECKLVSKKPSRIPT